MGLTDGLDGAGCVPVVSAVPELGMFGTLTRRKGSGAFTTGGLTLCRRPRKLGVTR